MIPSTYQIAYLIMSNLIFSDPHFSVSVLQQTPNPSYLAWLALHRCYTEAPINYDMKSLEATYGQKVVDLCIKFGHWSILEHPVITLNVEGYPHNVMVQATRHRHVSFSVQSQRYTGKYIAKLAKTITRDAIDNDPKVASSFFKIFYFRPVGFYVDREGSKYAYTQAMRSDDIDLTLDILFSYAHRMEQGYAEEHCRDFLLQNIRQSFICTMNARTLLHFCDMRLPKDAQLEINHLAVTLFEKLEEWIPSVARHYKATRYGKNKLAP